MRKKGIAEALIALIGGAIGYFLRLKELGTVFDEVTGLANTGEPVTIALIALSVALCVLIIVLGLSDRSRVSMKFGEAFYYKSPVICLILCLCGGVMIVVSSRWLMVTEMNIKDTIWCALTVLSGLAVVFMAIKTYRGARGKEPALATMMPVIYLCVWLIFSYTERAADPVLLDYVYEFFALAFTIMGFYYISGFAFGKIRIRSTLICSRIAVYFIIVNLADSIPVTKKIIYICLALILLIQSCLLNKNKYVNYRKKSAPESEIPEPEAPEAPEITEVPETPETTPETPEDFSGDFNWS